MTADLTAKVKSSLHTAGVPGLSLATSWVCLTERPSETSRELGLGAHTCEASLRTGCSQIVLLGFASLLIPSF